MIPNARLMKAIEDNSREQVREAIDAGASLTEKYWGLKTPLEHAQAKGSLEAARELIAQGADVNVTVGKRGESLLKKCIRVGDFGFMCLLLENGAERETVKAQGYFATKLKESGCAVQR